MSFLSGLFKNVGKSLGNIATGALGGAAVGLASDAIGRLFGGGRSNNPAPQQAGQAPNQALLNEASLRAFRNLDPSLMTDARVRAELARRAMDAGNVQAAQIAAFGGPLSAQRGAVIGAANQATTAANNYLTSLSDPERLGAAYMAQMSALNPMYGLYFQNMNAQNANRFANMQADALRPPSIFESAIGLAGQTAPLWLDQVFRPTRPTTPRINIPGQTSRIFDLYKN